MMRYIMNINEDIIQQGVFYVYVCDEWVDGGVGGIFPCDLLFGLK